MTRIVIELSHISRQVVGNDLNTPLCPPRWNGRPTDGDGSPIAQWRALTKVANMDNILVIGLVAIAVVVVMAGLLSRLVAHDDMSSYIEG
jgi:hypothetical protein